MKHLPSIKRIPLAIFMTFILQPYQLLASETQLISIQMSQSIHLDGLVDEYWKTAPQLKLRLDKLPYQADNYQGLTSTDVTLKSMHDEEFVYFLVQYPDPTKSLKRFPWQKQKDGSWLQLKDKDQTGHSNIYYEDKFAFFWEINTPGFAKKGCAVACHLINDQGKINGIDQKGITAGRKYTRRSGETIDMWHWKSVRMNPVGVVDDQFVDHVKDPKVNKNWGRHGDNKTGGGYKNNINKDKNGPAFMNITNDGLNDFTITPEQKTAFVDTFQTGDLIPGIKSESFTGSRGDISTKGVWLDGVWTIEMKRKLVTSGKKANVQDVQFNDLSKQYHFAISVFDNSQINHLYHDGAITFTFH